MKSPSVDLRTPVVRYLDLFCQSLEAEEDSLGSKTLPPPSVDLSTSVETYFESFCQLFEAEGDTDALTMTNLDSGDIIAMDQHVWDKDVDQWLDDVMEVLEDPTSLEDIDVHDLLEDMSPEEWDPVIEDVIDQFDLDLFVS